MKQSSVLMFIYTTAVFYSQSVWCVSSNPTDLG